MTTRSVRSKDGTSIGYQISGSGPGIVLVQGAMGTVDEFSMLAAALSDSFTVIVPERRGRGLSPLAFTTAHSIDRDVEDLHAVLEETKARNVFGLSSGAVISLTAAGRGAPVERLAVFEPPLYTRGLPRTRLDQFWIAMGRGDSASAFTAAGKAVQLVPNLKFIPDWLMTMLGRRMIAKDPELKAMVETLQFDFRVVEEMHGKLETWRAISADVLLMGGSKSPAYLKDDLDALDRVLPNSKRVTFEALDHGASWNPHPQRNRRGAPAVVAAGLRDFFGAGKTDATPAASRKS